MAKPKRIKWRRLYSGMRFKRGDEFGAWVYLDEGQWKATFYGEYATEEEAMQAVERALEVAKERR